MSTLHLVLAVIALLIGIWLVCTHLKDTRNATLWTGIALIVLSLCHLVRVTPRGDIVIVGFEGQR